MPYCFKLKFLRLVEKHSLYFEKPVACKIKVDDKKDIQLNKYL